MALFEHGFPEFLKSSALSDVTLVHQNEKYKAHRIILCFSSNYFSSLFGTDFKEGIQKLVELKFPDPRHAFPLMLRFMYEGQIQLTLENVVPLLSQAEYYGVLELSRQCNHFIKRHLKRNTVLKIFKEAIELNLPDLVERCLRLVASSFLHMYEADFTWMDPNTFLHLLNHKRLAVKDEWPLYKSISRYIDANPQLDSKVIAQFMETVRFRWMTYDQLKEASNDSRIPKHLIVEGLIEKLDSMENPSPKLSPLANSSNSRLQPRISRGIEFEYTGKIESGILYWLGTNYGKKKWANPHSRAIVKVTASSIERGGDASKLLDLEPSELWTCDIPSSWFQIDFLSWSVIPRAYTLRHGGNYVADSLRNWDLQGSVDGVNWILLRRHQKDESLKGKFMSHTWKIKPQENERPLRIFRIIQTGHNSSNHNFLVLSGFELYGELWETDVWTSTSKMDS